MTDCQSCTAAAELFLCQLCIDELRAALLSLARGFVIYKGRTASGGKWIWEKPTPGLLANLADVVNRQTRGGGRGGHRKRGDELPAPFEPDTANGRDTLQGRADKLMIEARNSLTTTVRDLCESRGIDVPATDLAGCAAFLGRHAHALASQDGAGQTKREIDSLKRRIERVVDRPPAPKFCGQCDTKIGRKVCGRIFRDHFEPIEVTCPDCHVTHNVERLLQRFWASIDHEIVPREKIIGNQRTVNPELYDTGIMGTLGEFVSWQQFNRWCRDGHLKPVRYLRPGGRRGFFRHSAEDVPEYRVGDVRQVRRKMERAARGHERIGATK